MWSFYWDSHCNDETTQFKDAPSLSSNPLPKRIPDFSVVERVNGNLGDNVGERDNQEGEEEKDKSVDEGVQGESQKNHQQTSKDNGTHFHIFPVQQA